MMIDIGTTTLQAAHHLHGRDITVDHDEPGGLRGARAGSGDRADPARRRGAPQLPLARRRARRGLAAPAQGRRPVPGHERRRSRAGGVGLHDGRGADQAGDDRGGGVRGAARRRREVLARGPRARVRRARARPHRDRRAAARAVPARGRGDRDRGHGRDEAHDRRRRGLPRAARLRRAAREGGAARPRRGRAARHRRGAARAHRGRAGRPGRRARRAAPVPLDDGPRRRRRGRRPRVQRDARRAARGAGRSTRASRSALGVLGQETTGPGGICFALRTIPAMVALAQAIAARAPGAG